MAPAVQWYPLYGEIFGNRAKDPSAATIRRVLRETRHTVAIIPGGFSEAVYTNAHPEVRAVRAISRPRSFALPCLRAEKRPRMLCDIRPTSA